LILVVVGGFKGRRFFELAFPVVTFFVLVAFARALLVPAGFFAADLFFEVAAAALFVEAAAVFAAELSFATSLSAGQSRQVNSAATRTKVLLSNIPSRSSNGLPGHTPAKQSP
jgi:hypothetical protein